MKLIFLILLLTTNAFALRTIDADIIKSSSHLLTWTLPATTGTMMCKDSVDVLTNKSIDAEGTGNVITNINTAAIKNGTITSIDISASAAIGLSKLASTTVSRAIVSDGSGVLSPATTTSTEIEYVNGVTSAIQTQINTKAPSASPTFTGTVTLPATVTSGAAVLTLPTTTGTISNNPMTTAGDLIYGGASGVQTRFAIGGNGSVLTASGTGYVWTSPLINPATTKGDLIGYASGAVRVPVGNDGEVLVAQASATNGMAYSPHSGRNKIQNGDMRIDQRNEGASIALASSTFAVDRWGDLKTNTSATGTVQRVTSSLPSGFSHVLKFSLTGIDSALAATDQILFTQTVEGSNIADLDFGIATAKPITLSFWVRSSLTGTYCVSIGNSASTRSYIYEYTVSVADTWEKKTVTIAGDTSGTWVNTENGIGFYIVFALMNGSTNQGTGGAWTTQTNKWSTSNQVNWAANASATYWITGVQLEKGNVATDFEWEDMSVAYRKAERFYQKSYAAGTALGTGQADAALAWSMINITSTTTLCGVSNFKTPMYTAPTLTAYSAYAGTSGKVTYTASGGDEGGTLTKGTSRSGFTCIAGTGMTAAVLHTFHYTAETLK